MAYLVFGQGPRNCLGMRFSMLELTIALTELVSKFKFKTCDNTPPELTLDPRNEEREIQLIICSNLHAGLVFGYEK
jgi:cytochrome P450